MATLLKKFVDAGMWESEDAVGRLGLVAHAAFLNAGFVPCGAEPPSGHLLKRAGNTGLFYLSRRYTAPELAYRHCKGAEAAVLVLCKDDGGDFALITYMTTDRNMEHTYRQRLDAAAMAPLLSSSHLDDAEPWGSWICKWISEVACGGLLAELCRRNGLPRTGFTSLPEDVVVEILKRITDPEDLASMASTSRGLRELVVAECKNQLRKNSEDWDAWPWQLLEIIWSFGRSVPPSPPAELHDVAEPEKINIVRRSKAEGHHRKDVSRMNDCSNKGRAAGAIHSPSSRYRWKHR